eukprot:CAMPEP_0182871392 /NCGR_PEP_ID=MMETSP0034_2-20130328/11098_1 /TAXON_ID=156128 /ORGANISM="Nephroselmis pyriformis, Strain CCMP717" /LENGTH=345 /DNA_ID=CAMNT_0025003943 /DNA_START=366 /DNA_END=1400 /DNA_ORIENTATION=-
MSEADEKAAIQKVVELCRAFPAEHFGSVLGDQLRAHNGFEHKGRRTKDIADSLRSLWPKGAGFPKKLFLEKGLCQPSAPAGAEPPSLAPKQVGALADEVEKVYNAMLKAIRMAQLYETLEGGGFYEVKLRGGGRYDLQVPALETGAFKFLHSPDAPWMPVVRSILGDNARRIHQGAFISLPGSSVQDWHSDGVHQNLSSHAKPHALNVFIPLVDLGSDNGPTEFVPASHLLGEYNCDATSLILRMKAGECVIFDYRLKHRGLGNTSTLPRALVYLTYAVPGFMDAENFNKKRYPPLPQAVKDAAERETQAGSRDQRMEIRKNTPGNTPATTPSNTPAKRERPSAK